MKTIYKFFYLVLRKDNENLEREGKSYKYFFKKKDALENDIELFF